MEFCPECGTRLTMLKKKEERLVVLLLTCQKCGYKKQATRPMANNYRYFDPDSQLGVAIIGKKVQKLRTTPQIKIECPKCRNKYAYTWQVHVKSLEESTTQFFRCTKCNYTFREDS